MITQILGNPHLVKVFTVKQNKNHWDLVEVFVKRLDQDAALFKGLKGDTKKRPHNQLTIDFHRLSLTVNHSKEAYFPRI